MSFIDFCQDNNIPFLTSGHHHTRSGWIQTHCPFCGGGKSGYDIGYNSTSNTLNCWRCGKHSLWDYISCVTNKYPREVIEQYKITRNIIVDNTVKPSKNPLPKTEKLTPKAEKYLYDRGYNPSQLINYYSIESTTYLGKEAHRIFIPVFKNFQPVSFVCRAIGNTATPKYLAASPEQEKFPLKHTLYNEHNITTPFVYVCEGPMDVWRLGSPAVATFGTQITTHQVLALSKYSTVVLCLDNDDAGQKATRRLSSELALMGTRVFVFTPEYKDIGDYTEKEIGNVRKTLIETATGA